MHAKEKRWPELLMFHWQIAIVVVAIQILVQQILFTIVGNTSANETLILAVVMLGICLGQSRILAGRPGQIVILISSATCLLLGLFYSPLILWAASYSHGAELGLTALLILVSSAGLLSSDAVYTGGVFRRNYFLHNSLCMLGILGCFALQIFLGNQYLAMICGLALLIVSLSPGLRARRNEAHKSLELVSLESISLGMISGIYLACVLEMISISVSPTGLEFHFYLIFVFLQLALASRTKGRAKDGIKPLAAWILSVFIATLAFGGFSGTFFWDPLLLARIPGASGNVALVSSFLLVGLYCLPYFYFSATVPVCQELEPRKNHLFSVSLGNFLGFALPATIFQKPSISWLFLGFFLLAVLYELRKKRYLPIAIAGLFLFLSLFLLDHPEKRVLAQTARLALALNEIPQLNTHVVSNTKHAVREDGKIGYLYEDPIGGSSLGLGGYNSPMRQFFDLLKAFRVAELANLRKTKRVLILGLGNQLTIHELLAPQVRKSVPDMEVDVVDNFPPMAVQEFQNTVGSKLGLAWPLKGVRLIEDDAFSFLAKQKYDRPYDLIINNLTWPLYLGSRMLYTKEFLDFVKSALTEQGLYLSRPFKEPELNCLPKLSFPHSVNYPFYASLLSLSISSKSEMESGIGVRGKEGECVGLDLPTLSRLFWGQQMHDRVAYEQEKTNARDAIMRDFPNDLTGLDPLRSLFLSWAYSRELQSKILIFPRENGENDKLVQEIKRGAEIFRKTYGTPVVEVRSGESDASALTFYSYIRLALRNPNATRILPFLRGENPLNQVPPPLKEENLISFTSAGAGLRSDHGTQLRSTANRLDHLLEDFQSLVGPGKMSRVTTYVEQGYLHSDLPLVLREPNKQAKVIEFSPDAPLANFGPASEGAALLFFKRKATYQKNLAGLRLLKGPQMFVFSPEIDTGIEGFGSVGPDAYLLTRWSGRRSKEVCDFHRWYLTAYRAPASALSAAVFFALRLANEKEGKVFSKEGDINPNFWSFAKGKDVLYEVGTNGKVPVSISCAAK